MLYEWICSNWIMFAIVFIAIAWVNIRISINRDETVLNLLDVNKKISEGLKVSIKYDNDEDWTEIDIKDIVGRIISDANYRLEYKRHDSVMNRLHMKSKGE